MILGKRNGYKKIPNDEESQILYIDQNDEIYISGYRKSFYKKWWYNVLNITFCGAPSLILNWYPQFIHLKCIKCTLKKADVVLVKDSNECCSIHSVYTETLCLDKTSEEFKKMLFSVLKINDEFKYFIHKDIKYIWMEDVMEFYQLKGWDGGIKCMKELLEDSSGYTAEEQEILLKVYGQNSITVSVPNLWKVFIKEILQPFYLFQIFSIILWIINDYLSYAVCVVFLSGFSIFVTLFTTKKQRKSLRELSQKSTVNKVLIIRKGGEVEEIDSSLLVPGDVIQIPRNGGVMPCDALLLQGHCIVNESTLTGESCPVTKTPPISTNGLFNSIISKRHVLFCGTEIVQTRYYGEGMVTAVTINTGFSTIKGELIRCLLHPKPLGFKFQEDAVKFVFWLFLISACGIFYLWHASLRRSVNNNSTIPFKVQVATRTLILDSLDLITIVVPPTLPAALAAGIAYSRSRLLSKNIFCVSPPKINVFGKLKLMCFDKTGTLTEEGLDLWGVLPCSEKKFGSLIQQPMVLHQEHPLVVALATCHSLTIIEGKLSGDPLDLSMFNSINWELNEPGTEICRYDLLTPAVVKPKNNLKPSEVVVSGNAIDLNGFDIPYEIGIVREFPFTSATRCMSVITRQLGADHMNLYCKGAPERIGELCETNSLPANFNSQVSIYAAMGFRVLGVAYKRFDNKFTWRKSQRVKREEVERELTFLGLIIMQNKLKQVSTAVMNDLRAANIRSVMITGDNLLTALSVSRECMMVLPDDVITEVKIEQDSLPKLTFSFVEPTTKTSPENIKPSRLHYAIDGKTWELLRTYFPDLIPKLIVRGTIFARMLPEQKTQVVEAFQDLDYIVGMCGDGANDYGAMKAAHVGVSLSETEYSVIAPFTSKIQDVSCIISLVQEGRCALVSTFVIFKYMTVYSLIQFISVVIIYEKGISFGNVEFLYVDLIVTSLLALVIGRTGPSKELVGTRPIARLMSFGNLFPLTLQVFILFSIQALSLEFLLKQPWFAPAVPTPDGVTLSWENTVVYCISLFQYLILALVYSKGKPYRQPFYKNFFFMVVFVTMTAFTILLLVWPFRALADLFEIIPVENNNRSQILFRLELLMFPFINLILSLLIEVSMIEQKWLKTVIHFISRKKDPKNKYKRILLDSDFYLNNKEI